MVGETCSACGRQAQYEAWGGPVMHSAETIGASMDRPYPSNRVFRCEEHREEPRAPFGHLWRWRKINEY
jgi:hypothetical protein